MSDFRDALDLYRTLDALRFFSLLFAIAAPIVTLVIVHDHYAKVVDWPHAYGVDCEGRGCRFTGFGHSLTLLEKATPPEVALFLSMWIAPVLFLVTFVSIIGIKWWRGRHARRAHRILPMED